MKKKSAITTNMTERDKKLLFVLGAILVLAGAYFFVFRGNQSKAKAMNEQNELLRSYVTELDAKIADQSKKEAEIISYNSNRSELLNRFFGGMTYEKATQVLYDMQQATGVRSSQITYTVNTVYFNQDEAMTSNLIPKESYASTSTVAKEGKPEQTYDLLTGYKTSLTVEFNCSNQQLKDMVDYIKDYEEKISLDSITVGYDEASGNLIGTYVLSMYAADGIDKEYEAPEPSDVRLGVANIFGSKNISVKKNKKSK